MYRKAGAMVNMQTDEQSLTVEIRKGEGALNIELSRRQELKKKETYYSCCDEDPGGYRDASELTAYYDVNFKLGDESKSFPVDFVAEKSYRAHNYSENLNKGIPSLEYEKLCKALGEQNRAVAQIFKDYILDDYNLERENNLSQSVFNAKLDDFLAKK